MEQREIWHVYTLQWGIASVGLTTEECRKTYEAKFAGTLRDGDWEIQEDALLPALRVRKWGMVAVFGTRERAKDWSYMLPALPEDIRVVIAGSPEEQELLDYGTRKLAAS